MKRRGAFGLTLMEILIVIAITTAITAVGVVGLSELQTIFKLRSAGDEIRALLQWGRELAVANKGQLPYQISLAASGIITLKGGPSEVYRYQSPPGIIFSPATFNWSFVPLTGQLNGCSLPCQIDISSGNNTELIVISASGIVN